MAGVESWTYLVTKRRDREISPRDEAALKWLGGGGVFMWLSCLVVSRFTTNALYMAALMGSVVMVCLSILVITLRPWQGRATSMDLLLTTGVGAWISFGWLPGRGVRGPEWWMENSSIVVTPDAWTQHFPSILSSLVDSDSSLNPLEAELALSALADFFESGTACESHGSGASPCLTCCSVSSP